MTVARLRSLAWFAAAIAGWGAIAATQAQAVRADEAGAPPLVAATAIVRDAAIDAIYSGMTDALRDAGYRDRDTVRLRFESAETDAARAAQLVREFARAHADVVVALTEPSVRAAVAERLRMPLVVGAIDLTTANKLQHDRRSRYFTGVVGGPRFDAPLTLIREIVPDVHIVAIPVNAGAAPDGTILRNITALARGIGLRVEELPVSLEHAAVPSKITAYAPGEAAIFLDTRIFPGAPVAQLIAAGEAARLPVFTSDEDSVLHGALAAVVAEPYGTGRQIGRLVAQILRQPMAARAPLQTAEPTFVVVNHETAGRLGIELPNTVLARRGRIIDWADVHGPRPRDKPVIPTPPADRADGTGDSAADAAPTDQGEAPASQ